MPELGVFAITAVGVILTLFAPLEVAFATVLAAWLLVPGGLVLPGALHVIMLVDRIVLYAFAVRLVVRARQPGAPPPSAYRLTPVHFAVVAVVVVGLVDGVLVAPGSIHFNLDQWLLQFDLLVLFVSALAVIRTIGAWRVVRLMVLFASIAVGIGVIERITGHGWAHYLSEHIPAAYQNFTNDLLLTRGGAVRAQGAAQFALEFGWVLVMLLPLVTMAVLTWQARARHWLAGRQLLLVLPVAAAVCVVLTGSRSAEVAVGAAVVLLVVVLRAPRRLTVGAAVAGVVVVAIVLISPSVLGSPFTAAAAHVNSTEVRLQHIPDVLALTVHRPFAGLGYTGLSSAFGGTDDSYILLYGQQGMIGVVTWGALLLTALAQAARLLRAPRGSDLRNLGAAVFLGIVAVAVAGGFYDLVATVESPWSLILLAALAAALAEQLPRRRAVHRRWGWRAVLPVGGGLIGLAIVALAPTGYSQSVSVYSSTPAMLAKETAPPGTFGPQVLDASICGVLETRVQAGSTMRCENPSLVERSTWPSRVDVRFGASNAAAVRRAERYALAPVAEFGRLFTLAPDGPMQSGRPLVATTAPLIGAVAGLMAMLIVPPLPIFALRRRRDRNDAGRDGSPRPEDRLVGGRV